MDFITWWFEKHYIWSSLLTPGLGFIWCIYKGLFWRGAFCLLFYITERVSRVYNK